MEGKKTTIHPIIADYAFPNSLKGQRGSYMIDRDFCIEDVEPYTRLFKMYFRWNDLERTEADGIERIKEVSDRRFGDCKRVNVRFIPRVILQWPNCGDHTKATAVSSFFPSDLPASTLDTDEFLARVKNLILKLGKVWNNDPRVAYLEMGIYGLWGEGHEDSLSRCAQRNMTEAFHAAFPDKLCMIRYPRTFVGEGFGMYWDSFAHIDEENYGVDGLRFIDWRKTVMGGEMAHNWGRHEIQPGDDMNDTLTSDDHRKRFLDYVFWQHNNHLGIRLERDERYEAAFEQVGEYQKRAGYRFEIKEFTYSIGDGILRIRMAVKNTGASPFYYRWSLFVALLSKDGMEIMFEHELKNVDIRKWMPGDNWNFESDSYDIPAEEYIVEESIELPVLPKDKYMIAVSIKDPSCGKPNVAFATTQYLNGGWHPMGFLGVDMQIDDPIIPSGMFADQRKDTTINYE